MMQMQSLKCGMILMAGMLLTKDGRADEMSIITNGVSVVIISNVTNEIKMSEINSYAGEPISYRYTDASIWVEPSRRVIVDEPPYGRYEFHGDDILFIGNEDRCDMLPCSSFGNNPRFESISLWFDYEHWLLGSNEPILADPERFVNCHVVFDHTQAPVVFLSKCFHPDVFVRIIGSKLEISESYTSRCQVEIVDCGDEPSLTTYNSYHMSCLGVFPKILGKGLLAVEGRKASYTVQINDTSEFEGTISMSGRTCVILPQSDRRIPKGSSLKVLYGNMVRYYADIDFALKETAENDDLIMVDRSLFPDYARFTERPDGSLVFEKPYDNMKLGDFSLVSRVTNYYSALVTKWQDWYPAYEAEIVDKRNWEKVYLPACITNVTGISDKQIRFMENDCDITGAFTIKNGAIELNPEGVVNGIPVRPTFATGPLVEGDSTKALKLKTIPGLYYRVYASPDCSSFKEEDLIFSEVARGDSLKAVDRNPNPNAGFYRVTVDRPPQED